VADIADVRNAMVAIIAETLFPNGVNGAGAVQGVSVMPGYPADTDLAAVGITTDGGTLNAVVAVYDLGAPRDTARFFPQVRCGAVPAPTLSWAVAGNTATLSGNATVPQNLCLVDVGTDYVRAVQPDDTLTGIASAMAALIPGATASGASVTTTNLRAARVGVVVPTLKEVGRQVSMLHVSVYASTDAIRSSVVSAIKPVLDDQTRFTLPDGSVAWIRPGTEMSAWATTKLGLAQSILVYQVEYPTVLLGSAAQMIAWVLNIQANGGPIVEYQG
jgi:hypothetical protein